MTVKTSKMVGMDIPEEAIEAAEAAVIDSLVKYGPDGHIDGYEMITRAALEAAAPHMLDDLIEEWAVQFATGSVEEAEDEKDARRKLIEIRECIADGIETTALEPMRLVRRYRVASSELTAWKPI